MTKNNKLTLLLGIGLCGVGISFADESNGVDYSNTLVVKIKGVIKGIGAVQVTDDKHMGYIFETGYGDIRRGYNVDNTTGTLYFGRCTNIISPDKQKLSVTCEAKKMPHN